VTASLYERYKDALRQGHVAALRGRLEEALVAYGEAARLAPERPLPHASIGGVLLRVGDAAAAIAAFDEALARAPGDEAALAGRADALIHAGRRVEAAGALDVLADVQEAAGRAADACDTVRRALEQAESKQRRRHVERLTQTLRSAVGDQAAEQALARAMKTLEETSPAAPGRPDGSRVPAEPSADGSAAGGIGTLIDAAADAMPMPEPLPEPEPEPDVAALTADAETSLDVGDTATARDRLLTIARIHARAGRFGAALDACYQALAVAPADPDLHLTLAELYIDRGWRPLAAEKLVLLAQLVDLADDSAARERMCQIIADRFPGDARLAAICS
jgi:tetratricopeptide (TPR) repeat protein